MVVAECLHHEAEFLLHDGLLLGLALIGGQCFEHGAVHQLTHDGGIACAFDQLAQTLLHVAGLATQMLGGHAALDPTNGGGKDVGDRVHQTRDSAVRADRETVAAGGAVLGHVLRVGEADLGHVAIDAARSRHQRQGHVRIGEVVAAAPAGVEGAGLLPEAVHVGDAAVALGQLLEHDRKTDLLTGQELPADHGFIDDLDDLVEAATHDAQVVLHDTLALGAELVADLLLHGGEESGLVEPGALHQRGRGEEGTLEGVALHADLQLRIGRLFTGDLEAVDVIDADLVLDDVSACRRREARPDLLGIVEARLDDEAPSPIQSGKRVGVGEDVRIRAQDHIDIGVFAVEPNRLGCGGEEIGGRLTLLLRAVLGIGADVETQQVIECHRQVLAGRDRAPAADRVHAHRDGTLGQQIGILAAAQCELADVRIGVLQTLDADLVLGVEGCADEVDRQIEELTVRGAGEHVLDRGDQALGLQIARAQTIAARIEPRHVALTVDGVIRVGQALALLHTSVLQALGQSGADLAHEGQVFGQRLVGALEHGHALPALEHRPDEIAREGAIHGQVHHADLELAGLAQIVRDRFGLGDHAALAEDEVVGILGAIPADALIAPPGQCMEFVHDLIGNRLDVIEEIGALRCDGLHVGVLVLYGARCHRVVDVPDHGHAAAGLAVDQLLGRGRTGDDVVRATAELGDQLTLGHQQRLDEMGGQKAILTDRGRRQGQLGDLAGDQIEIGRLLGALAEDLGESGVVDAVVVVVRAVDVEARLGDGARADVEHIGQTLAHGRVKRLVHEGHALSRGEVHCAQAGHGHAGGDGRRGMLGFGLDEDQRISRHIQVAFGDLFGPIFAHLGGRCNGISAGRIGGFALAHDDGAVAVHRHPCAGILDLFVVLISEHGLSEHGASLWLTRRPGRRR